MREVANRSNAQSFRSWLTGGAPWVWLQASAVSVSLLLVLGLLALIGWRGLGHFWPAPLEEWIISAEAATPQRVLIGQLSRSELVPAQRLREAGRVVPDEAIQVRRHLLKTGNRDLAGQDFTWVLEPAILERSRPRNLMVLERLEWGVFMGRLIGIREAGRLLTGGDSWTELEHRLARAGDLRARIEALQKGEIGDVNYRLEQLRLAERRLDRSAVRTSPREAERRATIASERQELEREFRRLEQRLDELYAALARDTALVRAADGSEHEFSLALVTDAFRPNLMGTGEKLAHFGGKLWRFLSQDPREANTEGGIFPALFGTILMVLLMTVFVAPLGVVAAVYLHEYARQGLATRTLRIAVHNLAGVPSIVYGVFGLGFFIYAVGGSIDRLFFSAALPQPTFGTGGLLWASLTLALLTLPVVIVSTEEGLARVPRAIREGSLALGATRWETLWHTVLPMASPGIMTGIILAVARGAGEVAPLMLVGVVKLAPSLPVDGHFPFLHLERKFMHLGFHIYDVGFQSPNVEAARPLVYATALLLVLITLLLNLAAIGLRNRLRERYRALDT